MPSSLVSASERVSADQLPSLPSIPSLQSLTTSHSEPSQLTSKSKPKPLSNFSFLLSIPTVHLQNTLLWIVVAAFVASAFALYRSPTSALEFTTAYIVEYSLSVDNLFVFLLIFRCFKVPRELQKCVLTYGILGAMFLRGLMVLAGKALIDKFEWLSIAFAALLIYSAVKLLLEEDDDSDLEDSRIISFTRNLFPVTDHYSGNKFFIREGNSFRATPLFVVLVAIELSDVVFALDSVPAVLGISNDATVIYTSNILAVMGLRSLFFVLSSTLGNLRFLKHSLSVVLGFIGSKMIAGCFGYHLGTTLSLSVVIIALAAGVTLSVALPEQREAPISPSCTV